MWTSHASSCCACCAPGDQPAPPCVRIVSGTVTCPPDMYRCFAAWLTICSSERVRKSSYMISTTGRMPAIAADPGADDRHLGDRRIAHPLRAELVEQALRDAHRPAHLGDVLAHQEDVVVCAHRRGERVADRLAIRDLRHPEAPGSLRASETSERGEDSTSGTAEPSEHGIAPPATRALRGGRLRRPGAECGQGRQA